MIAVQEQSPLSCVTPLYHFSSDIDQMKLRRGLTIQKFNPDDLVPHDAVFAAHINIHLPDYLLWYDPIVRGATTQDQLNTYAAQENWVPLIDEVLLQPTSEFVKVLHLFKPGRIRIGETFEFVRGNGEQLRTIGKGRCASVTVDYGQLEFWEGSYNLLSEEVPFLLAFEKL